MKRFLSTSLGALVILFFSFELGAYESISECDTYLQESKKYENLAITEPVMYNKYMYISNKYLKHYKDCKIHKSNKKTEYKAYR